MRKTSASESGIFTPRVLLGCALVGMSALLGALSFAANPAEGTITPTTAAAVTWAGTAAGLPPAAGGEADCVEGENCDTFKLTISGTPEDWAAAGKQVFVQIKWALPASDYDLVVHKGAPDGPAVGNSGDAATTQEQLVLNPASASVGTGDFYVRAVYFATAPGDQYSGAATVTDAPPPAVRPVPAVQASGVAPRYQNHAPPPAGPATLGLDAAEPSIGVNWNTEGVLPGTGDDTNGGRTMYIAGTQTLRVTFDDSCVASPSALWENKSFPTTSAITFDPILFTDNSRDQNGSRATGRTLISQLLFPAGTITTASAFTDNDGDLWGESTGAAPGSGIDHQTIGGGGPFHAPLVNPAYPNAVYYCAQLPTSSCGLSLDGGMTYGPAVPAYPPGECGGLHGHIKVGPDGTAYLPNKSCGTEQAVVVTEDNGVTWEVRRVPGSFSAESDAAVGIGRGDKTGNKGRVYLGYADGDTKPVVAVSDDQGKTWSLPVDVGAKFGINNVAFPAVVAGDDDRAAMAFYGTPTEGGLQGPKFNGIWHLYVATTYDVGKTWHTVDATPNDPMQRGCIWLQGGANICRNMLDFMGIDVDKRGRVLVAYNDGCAGAECSQAPPTATGNSYTALAVIARQTGGKGLFAADDALFPDAPTVPGDPYLTGLRNGNSVRLQWSQSNDGGSPVTSYNILRGTLAGQNAVIATVPGTQLNYVDATATDAAATYYYKVTAVNAQGTSCGNVEVPVRYVGSSHSDEGFTIYDDPANDHKDTPADPDLDIRKLTIAEPGAGEHAGKLVFKLKVGGPSTGNNRMWRIIWDSPNAPAGNFYVGATKNASGAISYEYGTIATQVIGLVLGLPTTTKVGDADAGSFSEDGTITIVISPDKVASPGRGDLLGNFAIRTYNVVTNEIRSTNAIDDALNATANDLTANAATYQIVGPAGARLLNISTRAGVQTGDDALIGGFIVNGSGPKKVLIRGLGPSLTGQSVGGVLQDPVLELNNSSGISSVIATNDDWKQSQQSEIAATGIPPSNDAEAAIVQTLSPGAYTAVLRGKGSGTGVGLVEVYDLSGDSELANLSSRGRVETGDNVMIGGVIVGPAGIGNSRIIVRAIGPTLAARGVASPLVDPMLELYDGNGAQLAANDNWKDSQETDITATQIAPGDDREAAIVTTAAPGNYTAIVRGKNDSTGVALVEAYNLR